VFDICLIVPSTAAYGFLSQKNQDQSAREENGEKPLQNGPAASSSTGLELRLNHSFWNLLVRTTFGGTS